MPASLASFYKVRIAIGVIVCSAACIDIQESDSRKAATKSDAATVALSPPHAPAGSSPLSTTGAQFDADQHPTSVRGLSPQLSAALRSDSTSTITDRDSSLAAAPTASDFALLRREIAVPVAGIPASALRDSYTEKRGASRTHEAIDIPAARGTPVLSAATGRVLKLFTSKLGGLMVYAADSSDQFILMYAHLDAYAPGLADGQPLRRGQQIGIVGTTGDAPPDVPHLHFAIARSTDVTKWWKGVPVNPYPLLAPAP